MKRPSSRMKRIAYASCRYGRPVPISPLVHEPYRRPPATHRRPAVSVTRSRFLTLHEAWSSVPAREVVLLTRFVDSSLARFARLSDRQGTAPGGNSLACRARSGVAHPSSWVCASERRDTEGRLRAL